jgi:hypothetical protein
MKLELNLPDDVVVDVVALIERSKLYGNHDANTHGPLDLEVLGRLLFEDVALVARRPGSGEGSKMADLLSSHGYRIDQPPPPPAISGFRRGQ